MTDIQPSPPGYRGQDEAPGPIPCTPGSFKYAGHAHHSEHKQQQSAANYVKSTAGTYNNKESYAGKQCGEQPGVTYRRKSENSGGRRSCASSEKEPGHETNNHVVNKKNNIAGYNEVYKKNTPGYKNDSGYSESLGFDSFSLPLNERDDASPPPTPPVRDASSLKGVCYGPGHEKYPSWPSAPERHPDEEANDEINGHGGSHRSKSWTDHTNYPKEKPAQYTRPLAKRPNPTFTQQLKTVMERCEKIPAETFEPRGTRVNAVGEEPRLWPRVDREGKPLGDAEYVVPSPPEREQQQPSQTISHAELEAYVRSYQDPQVDAYRETALTQAGLEEYTRVQHSQQASYAQSEGYHSYVSSVDSTTNTPFLDRLRRDSEAVAQRPSATWEEASSREGRDSVVTTSSGGSASSSETLKWHGSMSDVSVSSGLPARHQTSNDRWDRGSMSDVSSVNGIGSGAGAAQKSTNRHEKWQSSTNDLTTSLLNPTSSRHSVSKNNKWKQDGNKWQSSMNDRNCKETPGSSTRASLPAVISHCSEATRSSSPRDPKWQESNIDEDSQERSGNDKLSQRNWDSSMSIDNERYSLTSRLNQESGLSPLLNVPSNLETSNDWSHGSMSDVSQSNPAVNSSKQLIAHSARVQTPQRHHSESVLYLDRERTAQRKLYPIATTKPQENAIGQVSSSGSRRNSPVSPQQHQQQAHLSVAERICELEKAQQTRYTYLDPEKRHRVSDPTLKAIQKKALLSFYERHQHQSSWRSEPQLAQGNVVPTARSPPPQPPPRPRPPSSRRASSASDYSTGTWRDKTSLNRPVNSSNETSVSKHQHSNSCGSLSTDLLGPVIVGPAISIDDWVPERPPKKPHLRGVYNNRVPSPDLPPPSPPNVEETEVLNCDDPLPPPPPELSDSSDSRCENAVSNLEKRHRNCQQSDRQSRRSKHSKRTERDDKTYSRCSPLASTSVNVVKTRHEDTQQQHSRPVNVKLNESEIASENGLSTSFASHRLATCGRSSLRCTTGQKLTVNGRTGISTRRAADERRVTSRPPARLPDLVSQRYSDSGNQRPAPQVPVETRIVRQESMRVESTRIDASGLLRTETCQRYETSSGQRPQPQVPISSVAGDKSTLGCTIVQQSNPRPNYLALTENNKIPPKYADTPNNSYSVGSPVKTGYEANSKLMAEASPQKYHEPPKYTAGHHQRHAESNNQRYCYAHHATKYVDTTKQKPQPQCPTERYDNGSSSASGSSPPPPLAPRQNTPGRKSLPPPPRPAPPLGLQGSQSKASYLAYRRERGAPDSEGSYKRTMSPTARLDDWHHQNSAGSRDNEDPAMIRVTTHHPHQSSANHGSHGQQENSQQSTNELPKSHSVDALHQRIEERTGAHSNDVMNKLSRDLAKKLQSMETRTCRTLESNNNNMNNSCASNNDKDRKDATTNRSVEAFNDRNRQSDRRQYATGCESRLLSTSNGDAMTHGIEDFYRERSATIEMTSRNVELLNRRNALAERRAAPTPKLNFNAANATASNRAIPDNSEVETRLVKEKPPPPSTSPPRSPPVDRYSGNVDTSPLRSILGAVPRRSGSCSSSTSTGSSSEAVRSSRSSPRRNRVTETFARQEPSKNPREMEQSRNGSRQAVARRKVSSPSQTEKSWTNTPRARSSQTEVTITNASLRSYSSPRSRSSSLSSAASKISGSSSSSSDSPRYSPIDNKNSSPCVSPQPGIEGLTLVQRSEIVLRVNSITIDASCQTDIFEEDDGNEAKNHQENETIAIARRKLPEEIECEELSRDLANQLAPNDKLVPILLPAPEHKKPTDYVSGLFRVEATLQPRSRRPPSLDNLSSADCADRENEDDSRHDAMLSSPSTPLSTTDPSSPLSPTSAYFTTSEGKARFLTRYSRDVTDEDISTSCAIENGASTRANATNSANDSLDLRQKKEELVLRLDKKVLVLRAEQEAVREEGELNEALGARVSSRVSEIARPAEASKYRLHVEEVGKITSLLLGLSGRLARAENALYGMPAEHPERKILESKRDKLAEQLEEAKILKGNIDKRSVNVSAILSKYLNDEEYADYQHFINMKAKLIMDGREIQDKVKLGEEQLAALKEAID